MYRFVQIALCLAATPLVALDTASADVRGLHSFLAKKAGIVQLLHNKAERALVTAAQDETYNLYFQARTEEEKARLRGRIDHIGLAVQKQFAVEEMCLIDESGTEISRIVGREIAYDLSTEEASANFFAPTFSAAPRTVYLSPIYVSPDVHRWVTAYATPIDVNSGRKAILHYEHGLDFYEKVLNSGLDPKGDRVLFTVTSDGWVIFDSRKKIPIEQIGETEEPGAYFEKELLGGLSYAQVQAALGNQEEIVSGTLIGMDGNGYNVAYKALGDWTLIVFEPAG